MIKGKGWMGIAGEGVAGWDNHAFSWIPFLVCHSVGSRQTQRLAQRSDSRGYGLERQSADVGCFGYEAGLRPGVRRLGEDPGVLGLLDRVGTEGEEMREEQGGIEPLCSGRTG
jgi:hypothetical protein